MKIGILCEGELTDAPVLKTLLQSQFPEQAIFTDKGWRQTPNSQLPKDNFIFIRGVSKDVIFADADGQLISMFNTQKVERAIILWDLLPVGHKLAVNSQPPNMPKPKRSAQRPTLLKLLCGSKHLPADLRNQAHILAQRYSFPFTKANPLQSTSQDDLFTLICVCYETEGWFLSDQRLLCKLASTSSHQITRMQPDPGEPDKCMYPTPALKEFFSNSPNKRFNVSMLKHTHNNLIANEYVNQDKVDTIRAILPKFSTLG